MIWNDQILFIHVPKTAGMSLTSLLMENLPGNVFLTGHGKREDRGRQTLLPGKRHETMAEAANILEMRRRPLSSFEKIIAVLREPYTLEISRFNYLRLGHAVDKGPAQDIAMKGDFKEYLRRAPFFGFYPPRLDLYYHLFGLVPDNAIFIRFEELNTGLHQHVMPYLEGTPSIPHTNKTGKSRFEDYYDEEAEELCYGRHRWFFDKGFYPRRLMART